MTHVQYAFVVPLVGTNWTIEPLAATGLAIIAILYAAGVHRLSVRHRKWSPWRMLPFGMGLFAIFVATQSPLAAQDTKLFSAHVVQHLLLAMIAPPLLCLGAPMTLWLQAMPRLVQEKTLRVLHHPVAKFFTSPIYTWMVFVGTLFVLYFSSLYELSLRNVVFHDVVHAHFILAGFLFFAPIVAIDPHPHRLPHGARMIYMGLTLPAHAFLALALMSATTPLAVDWYLLEPGRLLADVVHDQKVGAAIMWISGDLFSIMTVGIVVTQWIRDDERAAAREDRYMQSSSQRV